MKIDLSIITKSINKELTQEADISLTSFRSRLGDFPIVRYCSQSAGDIADP